MVILQAIQDFGNWFWGIPILILIGGGGLFLTIYLGFPQIRHFGYAMSQTFGKMFAKKEEGKAIHMITNLYEFYIKNPEFLPEQSQNMLKKGEELSRVVCDYIAGMTDTYAVKKFTEFFIPESWKN